MRWWLALVITACGRIDFDPSNATCTAWGAFSAPVEVPALTAGPNNWGPALSRDGLTMYFYAAVLAGTGFDIWTSTRSSTTATWSTPVMVPEVSSTSDDRSPWISRDGLTLGFESDRAGGPGGFDLYWATRSSTTSAFDPPQLIPNVSSPQDEIAANLSANGLRLYMVSLRTGDQDLYVAERATTSDPFGTPVPIAELNSNADDRDIAVSTDELEVFLVSNRPGSQDDDIYRATRPDLATPWSVPERVAEVNSAMDDTQPDLSSDGSTMYLNYNTNISGDVSQIYVATRPCVAR